MQRSAEKGGLRRTAPVSELARDVVRFRGHPMVSSLHPTTIEVTTEDHLSENGDCIIGVGADKGCSQLDPAVKECLRHEGSKVTLRIVVGSSTFEVRATGDPALALSHPRDIVIRKSQFVSDRTLALRASAASRDIPRGMVRLLMDPATVGSLEIAVECH